jgi:threonine synthase
MGTGSLVSGVHIGFRELWSSEDISSVPRLLVGTAEGSNAIAESFAFGHRHVEPLGARRVRTPAALDPLVNQEGEYGQVALDALYDSGGAAYTFDMDELRKLRKLVQSTEGVKLSLDSAAALGALHRASDDGLLIANTSLSSALASQTWSCACSPAPTSSTTSAPSSRYWTVG